MKTANRPRQMTRYQLCRVLERASMTRPLTTYAEFKRESEEEQLSYLRWLCRQASHTASLYPSPERLAR